LLYSVEKKFGPEVRAMWEAYLSREPGDPLDPFVFPEGSAIAETFKTNGATRGEQENILREIFKQLQAGKHAVPEGDWMTMPMSAFFGKDAYNADTNYGNPFDIPGHIAGGLSGSDAGPDTRTYTGDVRVRKIGPDKYEVQTRFSVVVFDALDFIPGGPGASMGQIFTTPLSRLEASGKAYDVPFRVEFTAPQITATTASPETIEQHEKMYEDYKECTTDEAGNETCKMPDWYQPPAFEVSDG
jgi:hypothetical protein